MNRSRIAVYLLFSLLLCGLLAGICYVERLNLAYMQAQTQNAVNKHLSVIKNRLESNLIVICSWQKGW